MELKKLANIITAYGIDVLLIFFGLFTLLPFNFRGAMVIVFLLFSIIAGYGGENKFVLKPFIINSLLFLSYLLSLLYTSNLKSGLGLLTTDLSLIVIPLSFFLISRNRKISYKLLLNSQFFPISFFCSCVFLACFIIFKATFFFKFETNKVLINPFLKELDTNLFWFSDHPIYLSLAISISLVISLFLINNNNNKFKFLIYSGAIIQLIAIIIMSRKGVIIALIIAFLITLLYKYKLSLKTMFYSLFFFGIIAGIIFAFSLDTIKRFEEVFDNKSYGEVQEFSSTSIRYNIYKCDFALIKENLLFGYGIGDVKETLRGCYKNKSEVLYNGNYNSHNQYLGILLISGVSGLFIFMYSIVLNFKLFHRRKDYMASSVLVLFLLVMLFENILDRQNGVILFSLFINYFAFMNHSLPTPEKKIFDE
ncbi:O-antigen ligase family protein [Aestuariibaculum marinum]|uniref:O-antigen ligase family protein n=1 Tax=Aestuariibaculum marinum TaxID=2683592 RepID=A0A8J6UAK8_9FLAO|nr:O-antigen ligase family protein [Aestuariibaculum marinum]MBD0823363.1 O-antigen ligase family protein [Aestuariibaculum marinum]